MHPVKKKPVRQAEAMIRLRTRAMGIMAVAPRLDSHTTNRTHVIAQPQKSPIIVALFQACVFPPHSMARRSIPVVGARSKKPVTSRVSYMERIVRFVEGLRERSGMWMKRRMPATRPPIGRLM